MCKQHRFICSNLSVASMVHRRRYRRPAPSLPPRRATSWWQKLRCSLRSSLAQATTHHQEGTRQLGSRGWFPPRRFLRHRFSLRRHRARTCERMQCSHDQLVHWDSLPSPWKRCLQQGQVVKECSSQARERRRTGGAVPSAHLVFLNPGPGDTLAAAPHGRPTWTKRKQRDARSARQRKRPRRVVNQ